MMKEFPIPELTKKYKFLSEDNDDEVCNVAIFKTDKHRTFNLNNLAEDIFQNSRRVAITLRKLFVLGFIISLPHALIPSMYRVYEH